MSLLVGTVFKTVQWYIMLKYICWQWACCWNRKSLHYICSWAHYCRSNKHCTSVFHLHYEHTNAKNSEGKL